MTTPKFCRDCKWCNKIIGTTVGASPNERPHVTESTPACWTCIRPYFDPVSGQQWSMTTELRCAVEREDVRPDACGPDGKYFDHVDNFVTVPSAQ